MGDCKSPQGWSNLFRRRISNPPERLTDFKSAGTPNGVYPYALKGQKLLAQGTSFCPFRAYSTNHYTLG